ncbi:hypothetical protein WDU94_002254 [Cyamophila willieti]
MMETNQDDFVYNDSNSLKQNMAVLFNNPQHSDTIFIIGDSKLYAWSGLLSVASPILGDMINVHFENCQDREIKLHGTKHVESFSLILKYMYGLSINFSQTSPIVICEVLKLSNNYAMTNFSKDLTDYLCKIDCFSVESAVALLNTANKYKIQELNEKVSIFAYHNADELMNHPSFQDLCYDVLVNLLKSDWFFSSEINILKAALHWHSDLDNERENMKKTLDNNVEDVIEDQDEDENGAIADQSDNCEKELDNEMKLKTNDDNDNKHEVSKIIENIFEKMNHNEKNECSNAIGSSEGSEVTNAKKKKYMKTHQSFSENILKSLLALIRISQISAKDLIETLMSDTLFKNYCHLLVDVKNFSQTCEARKKHDLPIIVDQQKVLHNITHIFTLRQRLVYKKLYESEETRFLFEDLTCKVCLQFFAIHPPETFSLRFYLKFDSVKDKDWECTTECQLKLPSDRPYLHKTLVLPADNTYTTLTLTRDNPCVEIGMLDYEGKKQGDWTNAYKTNETCTFTVNLKSIHYKTFD